MSRKVDALKTKAEQVTSTCYVVRLRVFNRLISRIYNKSLSAGNLTVSQFNILTAILKAEPVSPSRISAALHIEKSTLSRNISLMRKKGWINSQTKGRVAFLSMTNKGKAVYEAVLPLWTQAQERTRKVAGDEIFQQIQQTVRSLSER